MKDKKGFIAFSNFLSVNNYAGLLRCKKGDNRAIEYHLNRAVNIYLNLKKRANNENTKKT